jgi:DivIVA domain-containing protein
MPVEPTLSPEMIEARSFTSGFRGYDQSEVREFLGRVAGEVRAYRDRTERLESAWHSAEERAARPPVLDEDTLMAAVGDETATILRAARAAAADVRTRAATDAERIVSEAEAQATQVRAEAEGVMGREVAAAEEAASRIVETARSEAAETAEKARVEADAIRAAAQQDKALTVEGAIATRERVLEDLTRRRRVASVQIEQLRAGRERLLESYAVVRRTLEEVNDELNRADAEARAAADEVGRRMQRDLPTAAVPVTEAAPVEPETEAPPEVAPADVAIDAGDPIEAEAPAPASDPFPSPSPELSAQASTPPVPVVGKRRGRGGAQAVTATAEQPQDLASGSEEATVPHLRVVPDGTTGVISPPTPAPGSKVDMLFARIRAARSEKSPAPPPASVAVQTPAASPTAAEPGGSEIPRSNDDEALLQRREPALVDLEASLTRKLKRTLQDEQNDLLDRLRSLKGEPTAAGLLSNEAEQTARYAEAAQPMIEEAAAAGVTFAGQILDGAHRRPAHAPAVSDLAKDAAATIVESLRRRLEHALSVSAGDEQHVLVEALGAGYREWKSERIERVAGDVLSAAFARGTWHEVPDGTPLRWIVDDTDGPCPDCDDDALAGNLPKGEAFPTGQPHPPAHPGCRCLLVPVTG